MYQCLPINQMFTADYKVTGVTIVMQSIKT
jgi:hypothetical protein